MCLNLRTIAWTSSIGLPFTADVIMLADDWLMEHPEPPNVTFSTTPLFTNT